MGEAGRCAPEPFEDVRGRADRHDADLPGLSQDGDDCVFGGLPVVGDQAAARSRLKEPGAGTGAQMIPTAWPGRSAR